MGMFDDVRTYVLEHKLKSIGEGGQRPVTTKRHDANPCRFISIVLVDNMTYSNMIRVLQPLMFACGMNHQAFCGQLAWAPRLLTSGRGRFPTRSKSSTAECTHRCNALTAFTRTMLTRAACRVLLCLLCWDLCALHVCV